MKQSIDRGTRYVVGYGILQAIATMWLMVGALGVFAAFGDEPLGVQVALGIASAGIIFISMRTICARVTIRESALTVANVLSTTRIDRTDVVGVEAPRSTRGYSRPRLVLSSGQRIPITTGVEARSQLPGRVYRRLSELLGRLD